MEGRFVSYHRVSTAKQGDSGLGLEAQRKAVMDYLNGGGWELVAEFTEVESGKNGNRPQLQKALAKAKATGATLIIAKLDRLSRNLHFVTGLMESGVDFVACDMPHASRFEIHIRASLAEEERRLISERTRKALAAARARGVKLGNPDNLTPEAQRKGLERAQVARIAQADKFAQEVGDRIRELRGEGLSLRDIAQRLNQEHVLTARGKQWTATAVRNVLVRLGGV